MSTWLKLHRQITDSRVFQNEGLLKVWLWCLCKASWCDRWVTVRTGRGTTEIHLKAGQFIFGRKSAAKELKMKPSSVRNRLDKLSDIRNLDIQPDSHYSVVTICNWALYQQDDGDNGQASGQATDRQRTGNGHSKEGKEGLEGKEKEKGGKAAEVEIPESLRTKAFEDAWVEWLAYRRGRRLTVKAQTLKAQLKKLAAVGEQAAIEALEDSVANGWQGIFPGGKSGTGNPVPTRNMKPVPEVT